MSKKSTLLLTFFVALSFTLTGCASLVKSLGQSAVNSAVKSTAEAVRSDESKKKEYVGNYKLEVPEKMVLWLPAPGWRLLQNNTTSNGQTVEFARGGDERIFVQAFAKSALDKEFTTVLSVAKSDSARVKTMLRWKVGSAYDNVDSTKIVTVSEDRGSRRASICIADSVKKTCDVVYYTEKESWVFVNVNGPLAANPERIGFEVVDKIDTFESQNVAEASAEPEEKKQEDYRKQRTLRTWGAGMSIWYNWEDEEINPERDYSRALAIREGKILDFGTRLAFTSLNIYGFNPGDGWHNWGWRAMYMIGFRVYAFNWHVTPFVGAQFGLGMQYDDHYSKFADKFAINIAGDVNAGMVFCRYCKYQVELGASYDAVEDGFFNDQVFGSYNFYLAFNY